VEEQGALAVLIGTDGTELQHVSDGKRYKVHVEGVKKKNAEGKGKGKGKGKGSRKRTRDSDAEPKNTVDEDEDADADAPDADADAPDADADASPTVGAVNGGAAAAPVRAHAAPSGPKAGPAFAKNPNLGFNALATRPQPRPLYAMNRKTHEIARAGGAVVASSSKVQLEDSSLGNGVSRWEESYERRKNGTEYAEEFRGMEEPTPPAKRRRMETAVERDIDMRNLQPTHPDLGKRKREEVELERERPTWVPTPLLVLRDANGELRRSAPAGLPTVPVTDDMSPADVLRVCWTLMPGNVSGGESVCRYSADGKISKNFYAARWRARGPGDTPAELDEGTAALEVRVGAKWVRSNKDRIPVVTNRHVRYHEAIYTDFFS
jgi:hypothetical protein